MISILLSRVCMLACGTLYPGYISFKTVRAKTGENYVKWMMYWIVFALFTAFEAFADIFLTWLPFYYEFKVLLILWLLPTAGNGSSFIYKTFIHPLLKKHESRIDYHLEQFREKGKDLIVCYMREASSSVYRSLMNVINKNLPNGVLSLLANNNIYDDTSDQVIRNIIIEEVDDLAQNNVPKKPNKRKASTKLAKNKNGEEPQTSRGRNRRTRPIVAEIDQGLND